MNKKTKKNILNEIHKQAENFSHGEEIANFVSHTVGAGLAILAFLILTIRASWTRDAGTIISFMAFGFGLIVLYTMSAIYHGLKPGTAKSIFEIFDHSAIYINRVSLIYLVLGGVLYSFGTIFYSWKICKFNHMIWHIFVILGSISHFLAVYYLI